MIITLTKPLNNRHPKLLNGTPRQKPPPSNDHNPINTASGSSIRSTITKPIAQTIRLLYHRLI